MKDILIVGSGGREHALGVALRRTIEVGHLWFAPGNAGTARLPQATNLPIKADDLAGLVGYVKEHKPSLVVVGPEVPLAAGLADQLRALNVLVFGPGATGAKLEASKIWAKAFMQRHKIPTATLATFETLEPALAYLKEQAGPYVIKADGLAAGKGVLVTTERAEAEQFAKEALAGNLFGAAGSRILVEEFMQGVEVSVLALCDTLSQVIIPLEPACDYKRAYEGDSGPNTGGMGAYSPPGFMTSALRQQIYTEILQPTLSGLVAEGIDYRGIVYAGLMITAQGPKVIEYNCRFGDPETQSLLPRLQSDLLEILEQTARGQLASVPALKWLPGATVGVVLAAEGYPGPYNNGLLIEGLDTFDSFEDVFLFHAGTGFNQTGQVVTNGGRVFNLVARGADIASARQRVYNVLGAGRLNFAGMRYRHDIAAREEK